VRSAVSWSKVHISRKVTLRIVEKAGGHRVRGHQRAGLGGREDPKKNPRRSRPDHERTSDGAKRHAEARQLGRSSLASRADGLERR